MRCQPLLIPLLFVFVFSATLRGQEADLVLREVTITSVTATQVEFCYRLANEGQAAANLAGVEVHAALSADEHHDASDVKLSTQKLAGSLAPGQSIFCCCAGVGQINPPQTPILVLSVDSTNQVAESNETNNSIFQHLAVAFSAKKEQQQETSVVNKPYPPSKILVKAPPSPTIIFEPTPPPTIVFLPQIVTAPRVINMQPARGPQLFVIGGPQGEVQIPQSLLEYHPPCLCLPVPSQFLPVPAQK